MAAGLEDARLGAALRVRLVRDAAEGGLSRRVHAALRHAGARGRRARRRSSTARRSRWRSGARSNGCLAVAGLRAPRVAATATCRRRWCSRRRSRAARAGFRSRWRRCSCRSTTRSSSRSRWPCSISSRAGASPTCSRSAIGQQEYAAFGRDFARRGRRMDACLEALRARVHGRALRVRGPPVRVLPRPRRPAGRRCCSAAAARAAVRRAARFGLGMVTQGGDPSLADALPRRVRAPRPRAGRLHRTRRPAP